MLDERKLQVLKAIIDSYVKHAEPVGSRTLSKQYNLGVSSATIRNEMSDLEELGMLNKQHTSSGRVPSSKAYRYYVDYMLSRKNVLTPKQAQQIKNQLVAHRHETKKIAKDSIKLLSDITGHTIILMSDYIYDHSLKYIRLIFMDSTTIVVVLIGDTKTPESHIVYMYSSVDYQITQRLEDVLNRYCINDQDGSPSDQWDNMIKNADADLVDYLEVLKPYVLQAMGRRSRLDVYSYGITNLLNFPDYNDLHHVKDLMKLLASEDEIAKVISLVEDAKSPEVMIGSEMGHEILIDSSIIMGDLSIDGNRMGRIALVGPMRMDYDKLVNTLWSFSTLLNKL